MEFFKAGTKMDRFLEEARWLMTDGMEIIGNGGKMEPHWFKEFILMECRMENGSFLIRMEKSYPLLFLKWEWR